MQLVKTNKIYLVCGIFLLTLNSCTTTNYNNSKTAQLPQSCVNSCTTPYGTILGSNNGVIGYSNCNTSCISNQENQTGDLYSGMPWQCVEYSRRWLQHAKGVTFGDVDSAYNIWDLQMVSSVTNKSVNYQFKSIPNGGIIAPKSGDLIIYAYEKKDFPYGHVGVIVNVNPTEGYADIAEQNYTNDYWENPNSYTRRIILKVHKKHYTLIDRDYNKNLHISINGKILGWKHVQ